MRTQDRFLLGPQLVLLLLVCLVVGSLEIVLLRTYAQIRTTSKAYAGEALVPLNLANVQREVLMLGIESERKTRTGRTDAKAVRLRASLLENQLLVSRASAASHEQTTSEIDRLRRQAHRYVALLRGDGAARGRTTNRVPQRRHLFARMEVGVKELYDREQQRSTAETGRNLVVQQHAGLLMLAISGLLLVLAAALALSLRRRLGGTMARLAALTRLNPVPLVKLAADGSLAFCNPAATDLARTITGGDPAALLPDDHAAVAVRTLATGERAQLEHQVGDRMLVWSFFPIASQSAVHCYGEDVTGRRALEEQLRQSQKLDAIGQLAGGIAHDFNNLLMAIRGHGELTLARLDGSNDRVRDSVEEIVRTSERAAQLTRQLLAFGRKQAIAPKVVDANVIVTETTSLLRRLLGPQIELRIDLARSLQPIEVDRGQIEQVLVNLAINARDAMPAGGSLTIETCALEIGGDVAAAHGIAPGPHVAFVVRDTGVGMDAETRQRVFEPFFTTKEVGRGTGLGLSVSHGNVRQNGGAIWLRSEPGHGTEFTVCLPASDKPIESTRPVAPAVGAPEAAGTILLVDDEEAVLQVVRETLEENGYSVVAANSPSRALDAADAAGRIDLLVTDLVMPEMSGRELSDRVLERHPEAKVLYLSGYSRDSSVAEGALQPGRAFLQKPFPLNVLHEIVSELLPAGLARRRCEEPALAGAGPG